MSKVSEYATTKFDSAKQFLVEHRVTGITTAVSFFAGVAVGVCL